MKKLFLASIAAIALIADSASAADLARKPVYKAAPPPVATPLAYDWSGFYAGVSVGERWAKTAWTDECNGSDPCTAGGPEFSHLNPANFDSSTVRAGGATKSAGAVMKKLLLAAVIGILAHSHPSLPKCV